MAAGNGTPTRKAAAAAGFPITVGIAAASNKAVQSHANAKLVAGLARTVPAASRVPIRVADASRAADLFQTRSWHIQPPPPPPLPPPPPPVPVAPAFPYTYLGAYTPEGGKTVFFLTHGDRVVDAHVGDRLDGVYDFESADANQLNFNYLPLNIRQSLASGAKP